MSKAQVETEVLVRFGDRALVTIASGVTCAYLGDERSLREHLVADELAKHLHRNGVNAQTMLIDDSLEPLSFRQLRVAVRKDAAMIEKFQHLCGKAIAEVEDPWGCHASIAEHFEQELMSRLHSVGCHPTIISSAHLYRQGAYSPFIGIALDQEQEIRDFLCDRFQGYAPEKLVYLICPKCGYMDQTEIEKVLPTELRYHCDRCDEMAHVPREEARGKLNWKLDCAARWKILGIEAETFNKMYMEPKTGTYHISRAVSKQFFDGPDVMPVVYGVVSMDAEVSYRLIESLPGVVLRHMFVDHWHSELSITKERVMLAASKTEALPGLTYLNAVKQMVPIWLLNPSALSPEMNAVVGPGVAFARNFLSGEIKLNLPSMDRFAGEDPAVLRSIRSLVNHVVMMRQVMTPTWEDFQESVRALVASFGEKSKPVMLRFRKIAAQGDGPATSRILYNLPVEYLRLVDQMIEMHLRAQAVEDRATVSAAVNGEEFARSSEVRDEADFFARLGPTL